MDWSVTFLADRRPTETETEKYIQTPLWTQLNHYIRDKYRIKPIYSYSSFSFHSGWIIKYIKNGRSLCTLYPKDGYFIALIALSNTDIRQAEKGLTYSSTYVQEKIECSLSRWGEKWLDFKIYNRDVLSDVLMLIDLRGNHNS